MIGAESDNIIQIDAVSQKDNSLSAPLLRATIQSQTMLEHAAASGIVLSSDIISPLVKARETLESGKWAASIEETFWLAASKLAEVLKPVTPESLESRAIKSAKTTKRYLLLVTISLLVVLVPFSIMTLTANQLSREIEDRISEICKAEPALACDAATNAKGGELLRPHAVLEATARIWWKLRLLNILTFNAQNDWDLMSVWGKENLISQFGEARWLSLLILPRYHTYYVTMVGTWLTYLYALLGATAYGLRNLSNQLTARTWTPTRATRLWLRLVLAFVAGFAIGIFVDFSKQVTLSPVARLGQPDGISPSRMAEMLGVDKVGPKVRC